MEKLLCFFFFLFSNLNAFTQFIDQDLVSGREVKKEARNLIKRFTDYAPKSMEENYDQPRDSVLSILHMTNIQFDFPATKYTYGEIRFYYGYEIIELINGETIFYLSLVDSDCCDFVSIFISTNHDKSKVSITLMPTYKEKETLFFSYQEDLEYNMEIATAMAHINPEVSYGEKPLQIIEISTRTFLEKFKKVSQNIWP